MRKYITIILILLTGVLSAQKLGLDVLMFQGNTTTAVRNTYDVPAGETWLIFNTTTQQLEIAGDDDVWTIFSGVGTSDGDKGDITVTSSGGQWDIDPAAVGSVELANNAVTSTKILNGTVTIDDIDTSTLTADNISMDNTGYPDLVLLTNVDQTVKALEGKKLDSQTDAGNTEPTGATALGNILKVTQAQYDAGPVSSSTLYIITDAAPAESSTGTVINLSGYYLYNISTPSAATTYTLTSLRAGGYAKCKINAASEPTVTTGTKVAGATFQANTDMYMVVYYTGSRTEYFFLEI